MAENPRIDYDYHSRDTVTLYLGINNRFIPPKRQALLQARDADQYSIFAQQSHPETMFQTHALLIRKSEDSRNFVREWWNTRRPCNEICQEQGAFYSTSK